MIYPYCNYIILFTHEPLLSAWEIQERGVQEALEAFKRHIGSLFCVCCSDSLREKLWNDGGYSVIDDLVKDDPAELDRRLAQKACASGRSNCAAYSLRFVMIALIRFLVFDVAIHHADFTLDYRGDSVIETFLKC